MTFPLCSQRSALVRSCFSPLHLSRIDRKLKEKFAYRAPSWEGRPGELGVVHDDDDRSHDGGDFPQRQKGNREHFHSGRRNERAKTLKTCLDNGFTLL